MGNTKKRHSNEAKNDHDLIALGHAVESEKVHLDYCWMKAGPFCTDEVLSQLLGLTLKETVSRIKLGMRIERAWVEHTQNGKSLEEIASFERSDRYPSIRPRRGRQLRIEKEAHPSVTAQTVATWLKVREEVGGVNNEIFSRSCK